jgi:hypothetical protein
MGIEREFGNLGREGKRKRETLGKFIIQFEWESTTVPISVGLPGLGRSKGRVLTTNRNLDWTNEKRGRIKYLVLGVDADTKW